MKGTPAFLFVSGVNETRWLRSAARPTEGGRIALGSGSGGEYFPGHSANIRSRLQTPTDVAHTGANSTKKHKDFAQARSSHMEELLMFDNDGDGHLSEEEVTQ